MPDTQLKSIELRNWTKVKHAVIEFPEKGLVLVHGRNLVGKGKLSSCGSGKTALGEAISRALLGVAGRYTNLGYYSPRTNKEGTLIKLNCVHKNKPLEIELGFKAPEFTGNGEGLRFSLDGQPVERGHIVDTRADMVKVLSVPNSLANWTVYLNGDALKCADLGQRESVELLMAALAQPSWGDFGKKTGVTLANLEKELTVAQNTNEQAQLQVKEAQEDLDLAKNSLVRAKKDYEEEVVAHEERRRRVAATILTETKRLTDLQAEMKALAKKIEQNVAAGAEANAAAENVKNEADEVVLLKLRDRTDLVSKQSGARAKLDEANDALDEMLAVPKTCPTCGKPWEKAHGETAIKAKRAIVEQLEKRHTDAQQVVNKFDEGLAAARKKAATANATLTELRRKTPVKDLSIQYENMENTEHNLDGNLSRLEAQKATLSHGPDKSAIASAETLVTERARSKQKLEEKLKTSATTVVEAEETYKIVEYWHQAFSPNGIPNMLLKDAIGPLNETARRISSVMSANTLQVVFSTSRELADGREKAQLNITVNNEQGASRLEGNSKGEGGLANLIVAETLAEVGQTARRIGYRWYDEISANQDELVRHSLYTYLKEVAQRYGILVFLVSHSPEAANYADHVLVAVKSAEGISYQWER